MAEINKPDLSIAWASSGLKTPAPDNTKLATGWAAGDKPPRWFFNWLDNRQDVAIQHINQHGVAVWDSATEYQANKSYVQSSTGELYRAKTTNTNKEPSANPSDWALLIVSETQFPSDLVNPGRLDIPSSDGVFQMRFGTATIDGGGSTAVTFSTPFANACLGVLVTSNGAFLPTTAPSAVSYTASGAVLDCSSGGDTPFVFYIAIGY